jgi:hypothetical protein
VSRAARRADQAAFLATCEPVRSDWPESTDWIPAHVAALRRQARLTYAAGGALAALAALAAALR